MMAPTTTTTTVATTTTTTAPEPVPAEVTSLALLPDETILQDGTWAAIVFRQSVDCIPEETDLVAGDPVECETSILFEGETPGVLVGDEVPVWLLRWPVVSYALNNGLTTLGEIRRLPTLFETTAASYTEEDGAISLTGSIPDMSPYRVDAAEGANEFDVPFEAGDEPALSELTGAWDTGGHRVRVDEGGSYEVFEVAADGGEEETGLVGFIALQDGLLIFPSAAGPPCSGETGVYFGYMIGTLLRIGPVDEPCGFRSEAFGSKWSLSSAG